MVPWSGPATRRSLAAGLVLPGAALLILLPIVLWRRDTRFLGSTYGKPFQPFELFGFLSTLALAAHAFFRLRRLRLPRTWAPEELDRWAPTAAFTLAGLHVLPLLVDHPLRSWDYDCYERAARALLAGADPYEGTRYLYPPLLAQSFAAAYQAIRAAVQLAQLPGLGDAEIFGCLFYLYQCLQLFMALAAFLLCRQLAERLGLRPWQAAALCLALFVFNNPLFRTLKHGQVNLFVLVPILFAMQHGRRHPVGTGLLLSLATHLKLYPILVVAPLVVCGAVRAAGVTVLVTGALFALEHTAGHGVLAQFVRSLPGFPCGTLLRDNSLHSVVYNVACALGLDRWSQGGSQGAGFRRAVAVVALLLGLGLSALFARRALVRAFGPRPLRPARLVRASGRASEAYGARREAGLFCLTILVMMLLSPLVWEHHYVLTLPLALWGVCSVEGPDRVRVLLAVGLVYGPPTFDVFPLSYHRIGGLLWLVWLGVGAPSAERSEGAPENAAPE